MFKKIINSKYAQAYLDAVIPIVMVYTSFTCLRVYFTEGLEGDVLDVLVIFVCSFLMVYGLRAICRDLRIFGLIWTLKNFFKNDLQRDRRL